MTIRLDQRARDLESVLRENLAVADAVVTGDTAYLSADPVHAPLLRRSADLEAQGRLKGLQWHEPAEDLRVAGVNRGESDFLYREIFVDDAYFHTGLGLPPGATVVDVGANIGMFTLRAARRSPGARIIAVEPVAELAAAVETNARLHGVNATVVNLGLGATEEERAFTFYPGNTVMSGSFADPAEDLAVLRGYLLSGDGAEAGSQLERVIADRLAPERRRIRTTTLTRLAADWGLTTIDLLKIDVEKAEAEVLAGIDDDLWPRIDRIVLEVHDIGGRLAAVTSGLRERGFDVVHEQDPRLARTPCHNVFAQRREAGSVPVREEIPDYGPTLRRLERQLREALDDRFPGADQPRHFTLVTGQPAINPPGAEPDRPLPATDRTRALADIWADLFGPQSVCSDADFFDLGGDSLTAVRLYRRLEEKLGQTIFAPDVIFLGRTFGALAEALEVSAPGNDHEPA
jgi:FkbM family methyltransferase